MFPLFVDVSAKRIVVFGGGAVAERKVSRLLDAGAKEVEIYSLDFTNELKKLSLIHISEPTRPY